MPTHSIVAHILKLVQRIGRNKVIKGTSGHLKGAIKYLQGQCAEQERTIRQLGGSLREQKAVCLPLKARIKGFQGARAKLKGVNGDL